VESDAPMIWAARENAVAEALKQAKSVKEEE
jgi:hypothetical protein